MARRFDCFVVLAEMRTGSNLLEANLNALDDVECHGEAFNPHFIGYPARTEILGITQAMRDADPARLIAAIRERSDGLGGFRLFHDHDRRARDICIDNPRCAKIVLTRNPLDSYVSLRIAQATGQWKLTNVTRRRDSRIRFDAADFERYLARLQGFQVELLNRLQVTGQTAFHIGYDDLHRLDVINGLAAFLGCDARLERLDTALKKQNPEQLSDKVSNYDEMVRALARMDRFDLTRTPNFEPRRGPAVPGFMTGAKTPLLFMPVRGGPEAEVATWLAALDGVTTDDLPKGLNQKELRRWKRRNPGHRSFTVLRHPAARAHTVFCTRILNDGPGSFRQIRATLRRHMKLSIPETLPDAGYDRSAHRTAFLAFLAFLRANLAGQTAIRVDAHWASQAALLEGMAQFGAPDMVLREDELPQMLPVLARQMGESASPEPPTVAADVPFALNDIHDHEVAARVRAAYMRDYTTFGFDDWQG